MVSMAKVKQRCPFSQNMCKKCAIFRGRHRYLYLNRAYRGFTDETLPDTDKQPLEPHRGELRAA